MDKTLRSILWILIALVLLSSFSTGWFFVAKERLYTEYVKLENLFKASVEKLNRELAASNKERLELKAKLEKVEKELNTLEASNTELRSKSQQLLTERDDLRKELAMVKKGKSYLEKKVAEIESDNFMAGLLKEKVALEVELKRLKEGMGPKDLEIERLRRDMMDMNTKLSKAEGQKNMAEEKLQDSIQVSEILSKDLLEEKGRYTQDRYESENIKIENQILKSRIGELEEDVKRFDTLLAEKTGMQLRIADLEKEKELRAEAYHGPDQVDLPPIVLQRGSYPSRTNLPSIDRINRPSILKGRIVTVNTEHDFVVIDLGKQDGLGVGTRLNVYRQDVKIGMVEVIQTRNAISACDIKEIKEGFSIEIDDLIAKQ